MRHMLVGVLSLFGFLSSAVASPEQEAMAVLEKWTKAFTEADVDGIVGLYAPDALFFGTGSKVLVTRPDGVRKYFEQAFQSLKSRTAALGDHSVMVISDTTVAVSGLDRITGVREGGPIAVTGRVTFVVAKQGDAWRIVHFHRSSMPN